MLSLEILQSIQQAEAKAEETKANAQREARDMLKATETACTQAERSAAVEHRALYQQLMEQNRLMVQAELDKAAASGAQAREALCAAARARLPQAAALIFERVVTDGHR